MLNNLASTLFGIFLLFSFYISGIIVLFIIFYFAIYKSFSKLATNKVFITTIISFTIIYILSTALAYFYEINNYDNSILLSDIYAFDAISVSSMLFLVNIKKIRDCWLIFVPIAMYIFINLIRGLFYQNLLTKLPIAISILAIIICAFVYFLILLVLPIYLLNKSKRQAS